MKRKSGQILILILLIVVVSLAVGLSVASRNITNLRTSTQAEHSQRALTAAEGGVEDVLSRLSTIAVNVADSPTQTYTGKVQIGGIDADVTVIGSKEYASTIEPGEIGQVDLTNATGTLLIEWGIQGQGAASLEVTLVNKDGDNYLQTRKAWRGGLGGSDEVGDWEEPFIAVNNYAKNATIDVGSIPGNPVLLRIKPFWARANVKVSCNAGSTCGLRTQTYEVVSEAQTDIGVTRKIQVTRTALPQLPAAFDYVLYSEGAITK